MTDHHEMDAASLRRWAMQCGAQATDPRASGDERERLLKMRAALLQVANTQDWLAGRSWTGLQPTGDARNFNDRR